MEVTGGYTRARKWRVRLDDGSPAFAKEVRDTELAVYESLAGAFLPRVHEIRDDVVVLEDLSDALWPPPYPDDVTPLFVALEAVAATTPPPQLRPLSDQLRWATVADDPAALLGLGLCSAAWLDRALPLLMEAEVRVPQAGSGLVHNDVWAGNMCFTTRGAVLIDWAEARVGNPRIDLAFALLALNVEGVSYPPVVDEPALAALVTGVFATEAPLPVPDWAGPGSTLRDDQKSDLAAALPWVAQQIGCPLGDRERR